MYVYRVYVADHMSSFVVKRVETSRKYPIGRARGQSTLGREIRNRFEKYVYFSGIAEELRPLRRTIFATLHVYNVHLRVRRTRAERSFSA